MPPQVYSYKLLREIFLLLTWLGKLSYGRRGGRGRKFAAEHAEFPEPIQALRGSANSAADFTDPDLGVGSEFTLRL
jgi:hypothetical protein